MTTELPDAHDSSLATVPLALKSNEWLGPAPCRHKRYTVDVQEQTGRCIDCGADGRMQFVVGDPVAAERERWTVLLAVASRIAEANIKRADDCGMLSRALMDALKVLRANKEFSGVPAGHWSNHPAGGTSAATQG